MKKLIMVEHNSKGNKDEANMDIGGAPRTFYPPA